MSGTKTQERGRSGIPARGRPSRRPRARQAGGKAQARPPRGKEIPLQVIMREDFDALLETVRNHGYTLIGPTLQDNAIVYDRIEGSGDLPAVRTVVQEAGHSRVESLDSPYLFAYTPGPRSLKNFLDPSRQLLWRAKGNAADFTVEENDALPPRYAFVGVRAGDLAGLGVLDRVNLEGKHVKGSYKARREAAFIIAVSCSHPSSTCFCSSLGTGPEVTGNADLLLTEVVDAGAHYFTATAGSGPGRAVLAALTTRDATEQEAAAAAAVVAEAEAKMGHTMEPAGLKELLYGHAESPQWDDVANRCLSCGNCTMVCPTCFCNTVQDTTNLAGDEAERWRVWDSCFTLDFSFIHGGSVRKSLSARYRHWITHKLATWQDQFGMLGCVGCGRCITWCPAGIDITEEIARLRGTSGPGDEGNGDA